MNRTITRTFAVVALAALVVVGGSPAAFAGVAPGQDPQILDGVTASGGVLRGWTSPLYGQTSGGFSRSPYVNQAGMDVGRQNLSYSLARPYTAGSAWFFDYKVGAVDPNTKTYKYSVQVTAFCSATATGAAVAESLMSSGSSGTWTSTRANPTTVSMNRACNAARPYLLGARYEVLTAGFGGQDQWTTFWWWAGSEVIGAYDYTASGPACDLYNPPAELCSGGGSGEGAFGDDDPQAYLDAADFDVVCADAPQAEWLSFSWLGPWVGHYASCLFDPKAGMQLDPAAAAMEDSFIGETGAVFTALGEISVTGGCGQLFSTTVAAFGGQTFAVNTCNSPWPAFASARDLLGIGLIIATILLIISRLLRIAGFTIMEGTGEK